MNFTKLKDIILYIQAFVGCPSCKGKLSQNGIHVIATLPDFGLLAIQCFHCHLSSVMQFTMRRNPKNNENEFLDVKIQKNSTVTTNDVIDVYLRLKNFQGDIKELFT